LTRNEPNETIMRYPLRSILAATDLGAGSNAIVSSAARLAAWTGAELHLLHALDLPWHFSEEAERRSGFREQIEEAEGRLQDQARRILPEGVSPASGKVLVYTAHKAILDRAEEVSADLIVVGPHRGGPVGAHFLGTTADRVIRTAEVPCLVVDEPLTEPIRRIGVPIDCSDPSQGALEVALAWGLQVSAGAEAERSGPPEIRVMHVGWIVEQVDDPEREERVLRPQLERQVERARSHVPEAEALDVGIEVLWGNNPTEETVHWVTGSEIDLIVMGTQGSTGLKRALLGSMASRVARQTPRPVLLVPPLLWSGQAHAPALRRVMIATDFHESALAPARWSTRDLAPEAEHLLVHVLEVPEPPGVLAGRYGSREELLRTAREGARQRLEEVRAELDAGSPGDGTQSLRAVMREGQPADEIVRLADEAEVDLVVMGGQSDRERSGWTTLGTTAERVLRASPVPVLVARRLPHGPPRTLLVAVDGSEPSRRALAWADFLRSRFGGSCTALHVESPVLFEYSDLVPSRSDMAAIAAEAPVQKHGRVQAREQWLREEVRRAGVDPDTIALRVTIGRPADEILAEQERSGADLIVMGTHGSGTLVRALLGSVAGAVLRKSPCSVLVVGDLNRANA
jgi:nucleotide-binding universal stress UspA family protein